MLEKNSLYQIQPLTLEINDVIFVQDEIIEVIDLKGINAVIKKSTGEIKTVSARGLEFAVEKI